VYLRGRASLFSSNYYGLGYAASLPSVVPHARAAVLVHEMFRVKQSVDHERLPPMLMRGVVPLCMEQYRRLFATTRVPGLESDALVTADGSKHVAVFLAGAWYRLDAFDNYNRLLSPYELQAQFAALLAAHAALAPPAADAVRLAAMTTAARGTWAAVRAAHFDAGLNAASLACIESAAFCVVLDPAAPATWSEQGRLALTGTGATRWLDKSLTLCVFSNGCAAVHAEHTWGDAPVTAHMWEIILWEEQRRAPYDPRTGLVRGPADGGAPAPAAPWLAALRAGPRRSPAPVRLAWDLSSTLLQAALRDAEAAAHAFIADVDLEVLRHDGFGKGFIKTCRVAPDAFIQLALQLAYFRDQGRFDLTYESAMTRIYRAGRTETIRSLSGESCAFVRAMEDPAESNAARTKLLRAAAERHKVTSNLAMTGQGVDRHLFALYVVARGKGYDASFLERTLSMPWRLTTSQLPQKQTTLEQYPEVTDPARHSPSGGFAAGAPDGYGVSYMVAGENHLYFHVSSYRACAQTDSMRMARRILQALADLRAIHDGTYAPGAAAPRLAASFGPADVARQ
jgi:carnitine O-palmitoyltransferase 1